jgi:hypothetical protein
MDYNDLKGDLINADGFVDDISQKEEEYANLFGKIQEKVEEQKRAAADNRKRQEEANKAMQSLSVDKIQALAPISNQSTDTLDKGKKTKKYLIWGGVGLVAVIFGVILVVKLRKK